MNVLIVDDEALHAQVIAEYLSLSGIKSAIRFSGNEAIEWLKSNDCSAVITDINMPNGTGFDLITWIKKMGKTTKVVAMSGGNNVHEIEQFCEVMEILYLQKPIDLKNILSVIQ